jgi:hypothetical protein
MIRRTTVSTRAIGCLLTHGWVGTAEQKGATMPIWRNDFTVAEPLISHGALLPDRLRRRCPDVAQCAISLELYAGDAIREPWRSQEKRGKSPSENPIFDERAHMNPRIKGAGPAEGTPIAAYFSQRTGSEFPARFTRTSRTMAFCRAGQACPDPRYNNPTRRLSGEKTHTPPVPAA